MSQPYQAITKPINSKIITRNAEISFRSRFANIKKLIMKKC